jgi:hypothetical protein
MQFETEKHAKREGNKKEGTYTQAPLHRFGSLFWPLRQLATLHCHEILFFLFVRERDIEPRKHKRTLLI